LVLVPYINGIRNLVPDLVLQKLKISGSSSATSSKKSDPILIWFLPTETRTDGSNPPNQVNAQHYNKPEITIKQIEGSFNILDYLLEHIGKIWGIFLKIF
jgi:hypothetical protein